MRMFAWCRERPVLVACVQVAAILLFVGVLMLHVRGVEAAEQQRDEERVTREVVTGILAETCAAADPATLRQRHLTEECQLARDGQIGAAIKRLLPVSTGALIEMPPLRQIACSDTTGVTVIVTYCDPDPENRREPSTLGGK